MRWLLLIVELGAYMPGGRRSRCAKRNLWSPRWSAYLIRAAALALGEQLHRARVAARGTRALSAYYWPAGAAHGRFVKP